MGLAHEGAARDKTSAANSGQEVVEITNLLEELKGAGPLSSDYILMIKGWDVGHLSFFDLFFDHLVQVVFKSIKEHHFSAITSNGSLFNIWSVRRKNDTRLDP